MLKPSEEKTTSLWTVYVCHPSRDLWNFRFFRHCLEAGKPTVGGFWSILRITDTMNHDIRACFQEAYRSSAKGSSNLRNDFIGVRGRASIPDWAKAHPIWKLLPRFQHKASWKFQPKQQLSFLVVGKHLLFEFFKSLSISAYWIGWS